MIAGLWGDGGLGGTEACNDADAQSSDGCSTQCEPAGTVFGCTDLVEGRGHYIDSVRALLPLADGSFIAAGALAVEGERTSWVGRYGDAGEQLWFTTPTPLGDFVLGHHIIDLATDPSRGYWALLDTHPTDELLHIDAFGQIDTQITLAELLRAENVLAGAVLDRLLGFDGRLWLAGAAWKSHDSDVDMWLAIYDTSSATLSTILLEDYAGYHDEIRAIAASDTELAVLATVNTSPEHDEDLLLRANSDVLLLSFDRHGVETDRVVLGEQASSIATVQVAAPPARRVARALASDGEGGWVVGAVQYDGAWVTRVHPTKGWTWTSRAIFPRGVAVEDLVVIDGKTIVVGSTVGSGVEPWIVGLGSSGRVEWQRYESDAHLSNELGSGAPTRDDLGSGAPTRDEEYSVIRTGDGRVQRAGKAWTPDERSVLRSCNISP
jgi:cysteine-rich repeat protein